MLGRLDESIEFQKQAIALDPLRVAFYAYLGNLLYEAARYEEAITAFRKALDLNPEHGFIHSGLGQILLAQGHLQEALAEMHREPVESEKLTGEALVYHALGHRQESDAALTALIAIPGANNSSVSVGSINQGRALGALTTLIDSASSAPYLVSADGSSVTNELATNGRQSAAPERRPGSAASSAVNSAAFEAPGGADLIWDTLHLGRT